MSIKSLTNEVTLAAQNLSPEKLNGTSHDQVAQEIEASLNQLSRQLASILDQSGFRRLLTNCAQQTKLASALDRACEKTPLSVHKNQILFDGHWSANDFRTLAKTIENNKPGMNAADVLQESFEQALIALRTALKKAGDATPIAPGTETRDPPVRAASRYQRFLRFIDLVE
jgi:hypothetical protein